MDVNDRVQPPGERKAQSAAGIIDRFAVWVAWHWLAFLNVIVAIFIILPFLAPVLMESGRGGLGRSSTRSIRPPATSFPNGRSSSADRSRYTPWQNWKQPAKSPRG